MSLRAGKQKNPILPRQQGRAGASANMVRDDKKPSDIGTIHVGGTGNGGHGERGGLIVGLFFLAYAMAKKRRKTKLKQMEEDEATIDQVISTIDHLKKRALPAAPRARAKERIPTKIRVDDEIHTLH